MNNLPVNAFTALRVADFSCWLLTLRRVLTSWQVPATVLRGGLAHGHSLRGGHRSGGGAFIDGSGSNAMSRFNSYAKKYSSIHMRRENGILEMRFHI
jgi:hypothetical protein